MMMMTSLMVAAMDSEVMMSLLIYFQESERFCTSHIFHHARINPIGKLR